MKKSIIRFVGIGAAAVLSLAFVAVLQMGGVHKAQALSSYFTVQSSNVFGAATATTSGHVADTTINATSTFWGTAATGTASQIFMTAGTATTTYIITGNNSGVFANANSEVDSNYLFIQFNASNTTSVLAWKTQFSNGQNCIAVQTGCDWFDEDIANSATVSNFVDHASSTVAHRWQPGNSLSSTTLKVVQLPPVAALYKRVVFWIPTGSTAGSIWVQDTAKRNASGQ